MNNVRKSLVALAVGIALLFTLGVFVQILETPLIIGLIKNNSATTSTIFANPTYIAFRVLSAGVAAILASYFCARLAEYAPYSHSLAIVLLMSFYTIFPLTGGDSFLLTALSVAATTMFGFFGGWLSIKRSKQNS